MSSALEQFTQPGHPLILREDITQVGAKCHVCTGSVLGNPTYTCPRHPDDVACRSFFLHETCAKLPTHITHHKHNQHRLTLENRADMCLCDVCSRSVKVAYACDECDFDVCVFCTSDTRMLHHAAHKEHELILMNRKALVECDACGVEAKDSTYVCTTCEFWIHKKCAFAASVIPSPSYHGHPLHLIYSIPEKHRKIQQDCKICDRVVYNSNWMYYCDQCTYFVHMNCVTSPVSKEEEDESDLEYEFKDLRNELTYFIDEHEYFRDGMSSFIDIYKEPFMDKLPDSVPEDFRDGMSSFIDIYKEPFMDKLPDSVPVPLDSDEESTHTLIG